MSRLRCLMFSSLCLLAFSGCSQRKAEVSGTITLDDKPVEAGTITFIPVDGKATTEGGAISDGRYTVHLRPGTMKITISALKLPPGETPSPAANARAQETIPARYNRNSELIFEVKAGKNQKDLDLKKE